MVYSDVHRALDIYLKVIDEADFVSESQGFSAGAKRGPGTFAPNCPKKYLSLHNLITDHPLDFCMRR